MCDAKGHVRFTPNNDRESGFPQEVTRCDTPVADRFGVDSHWVFPVERSLVQFDGRRRTPMINPIKRYHPERHYMRGPGPKWLEKHSGGIDRIGPVMDDHRGHLLRGFLQLFLPALRGRRDWP